MRAVLVVLVTSSARSETKTNTTDAIGVWLDSEEVAAEPACDGNCFAMQVRNMESQINIRLVCTAF